MNEKEFNRQSREAMQFMREMQARADNKSQKPKEPPQPIKNIKKEPNIPQSFFGITDILKNGDTTLILGLLLLLFNEKADKKLLFALIYILL